MTKAFWIHLALVFSFLVLMVASKTEGGGRSKRSGSNSEGNQSPNPEGNSYNKFSKSGTIWKNVAEVVGFMLGKSYNNVKYLFGNDKDSRYYNSYQSQMPNRVFLPIYLEDTCVTKDRFVTDCYNMSMHEYVIKPNEGKNISEIDQTEVRVKSTLIRELCVSEYKREPVHYMYKSGMNLILSPSPFLFIPLFVYFVIE